MKKIVLLLTFIILSVNCANAQPSSANKFKDYFNKTVLHKKGSQEPAADVDMLTKSQQAVLYYNENNLKGALEVLLSISENDRTAQDWLLLGNILQDQGKNTDAVFMYQRAITVNPKFYKPYYNLANIYLEEEKPFMAIEAYRKANKANPDFAYGYYNLGCAYLKVGNLNKAKIAFLKAVELKNSEPDFHYNLAYTYKKLNKPKLAKQYLENYNKLINNQQLTQ